jgi:hypothetical protein
VVDEGEEDLEVLRRYNGEIDDYECALEDDSSDDEDESIMPSNWERVVKKETEQPSGPMFIENGALGIWEQTSTANSRTSN